MNHVSDILKQRKSPETSNSSGVIDESNTNIPPKEESAKKELKIAYIEMLQKSMPPRYPDLQPNDKYLWEMKHKKKSFLFTGGVGTGKTRKLLEVLMAYIQYRTEPFVHSTSDLKIIKPAIIKKYFLTVTDVLRKIKDEFDVPNPDGGIMERMIQADILFLDDLGAEKASEWVKEQLYTVINERYNWMRPVMITTNLTIKEIADCYGDRMASRLVEMCEVEKFTGRDWRVEK